MEELRYKPVTEVEPSGKFVKNIGFKPKLAPYIILAIGVGLLLIPNLLVRIMAVFFILMSAVVISLVKDYKVLEIYSEGIMLYADREGKLACFVPYDDIKTWTVIKDDGHDILSFTLQDGGKIYKNSFQAYEGYRAIDEIIPTKEEHYIKKMEERQRPFDWKVSMENMRNQLFKKK